MNPERTTEMRSVVWWDSCCVSVPSLCSAATFIMKLSHSSSHAHSQYAEGLCLTSPFQFLYLSFTDYILEHSEDDTKSLFSIIKVGRPFHKSWCSFKSCHWSVGVEKYPHIRLQGIRNGNGGAFWERSTSHRCWCLIVHDQTCGQRRVRIRDTDANKTSADHT